MTEKSHRRSEAQRHCALSNQAIEGLLTITADAVDDLEQARIAAENRARSIREVKEWEEIAKYQDDLVEGLHDLEKGAILDLKRTLHKHPLGPWQKRTVGIGEKQLARLLAAIGNPIYRPDGDGEMVPRTVSQLWAFCGFHTVDGEAARRRKGRQSNWSSKAKSRAFLMAESCIKHANSPYRALYDESREKYAEAIHSQPCPQCVVKGKPSPVGSPLRDGHKHARALRIVAKAILRDIWREYKEAA